MNLILQANQKIQSFKQTHKKTYWICLISLWLFAPIEMGVFTVAKKVILRYVK